MHKSHFTQNGLIKACERGLKEVVSLAIVKPGTTCDVNSTDEVCSVNGMWINAQRVVFSTYSYTCSQECILRIIHS